MGEDGRKILESRTKAFAIRIIRLYSTIPKNAEGQILGKQLLRSGTSVGAHYREASRARSRAEFVSKIEGGIQELEETMYWLELLCESRVALTKELSEVRVEADQLMAILVSSAKTAKSRS